MTQNRILTTILASAGLSIVALALGTALSPPASAAPGTAQVQVVNTASQPVPTISVGGPAVIVEQTFQVDPTFATRIGPFDVSDHGQIRVYYQFEGSGFYQCSPQIVAGNGTVFALDDPMSAGTFPRTRVYEIPGPAFQLSCIADASTPGTLRIAIYGQ
jgi:hypothetical protein